MDILDRNINVFVDDEVYAYELVVCSNMEMLLEGSCCDDEDAAEEMAKCHLDTFCKTLENFGLQYRLDGNFQKWNGGCHAHAANCVGVAVYATAVELDEEGVENGYAADWLEKEGTHAEVHGVPKALLLRLEAMLSVAQEAGDRAVNAFAQTNG